VTAPPAVVPAPRAFEPQPPTRIDRPKSERSNGTIIIAIAVGVAVTILVLAFWFRSAQQEAAHQRLIDERVRQIQDQ
jgi:flagellar basal body-associated protein FliL